MATESTTDYLQFVHRYVEFCNDPHANVEGLKAFYDEEVDWREMPNRFVPHGRSLGRAQILAEWEQGREYLSEQTYTLRNAVVGADNAAIELGFAGTLAQPFAGLPAGARLNGHIALFFRFRAGKIIDQTDYLCYDPPTE